MRRQIQPNGVDTGQVLPPCAAPIRGMSKGISNVGASDDRRHTDVAFRVQRSTHSVVQDPHMRHGWIQNEANAKTAPTANISAASVQPSVDF